MLEISVNSLSTIRGCPMKYKWHYIDGYTPYKKSNHLTLGSAIHSAFDMYYNKFPDEEVMKACKDMIDAEISKASPAESEDLHLLKYVLLGMWINFPKSLSSFNKIDPELKFRIKLFDDIWFVGRVDGLVRDDEGRLWVRELKTTSMSFQQFERRSKTATQGTAYVWAMRKLGHPVVGMMYDFIKKPLLRKGVRDDVDTFGARIMDDYKKRPEFYFKRHFSYRNEEELALFEEDLLKTALEIRDRAKNNNWCRNQDQCWNFNSECPYLKICFQKVPDPLTLQLYFEHKPRENKGGTDEHQKGRDKG